MSFVHFMLSIAGRLLRVFAGVAIIWIALRWLQPPWSYVVAALGLVPIAAGLLNFCLFGPIFNADLWGHPKGSAK